MYWTVLKYGGLALAGVMLGWTLNGWRLQTKLSNLEASYAVAFAQAQKESLEKQKTLQSKADSIRKETNEKIQSIQRGLDIAVNSLRKRPSISEAGTTSNTGNGQAATGCTGAQLYRENAEDLIREAARADTIREGLDQCYKQYDSVRETLNLKQKR